MSKLPKLPGIAGLPDQKAITVAFSPQLMQIIESNCRAEWKELHTIDSASNSASPFIPYDEYAKSEEGRTHMYLLNRAFCIRGGISGHPRFSYTKDLDLSEFSAAMSRLQAQRYNTRGTRRRFEKRAHSATDYRKFRNWWINKYFSQLANLEFSEPCPFQPYQESGPTKSYIEMGHHFEEWTGLKLPEELWAMLKRDEVARLASFSKLNLEAA